VGCKSWQGGGYRLVFTGDDAGALVGNVYDLSNPATSLATISATDTAYASGFNGVFVFDNTASPSTNAADATFDNYFAAASLPVPEPAATAGAVAALFALASRPPCAGRCRRQ
jgi:hypothetical protein